MTKRSFDQYCPIARSLEVVGERWSLLIVRELMLGPKRYTDLRRALPGMWTNLLANRLAQLEAAGVVIRRVLPPPAARTVYDLTERGRQLEDVLFALGRWGFPLLPRTRPKVVPASSAVLIGLRAWFDPNAATGLEETYELRMGGSIYAAEVRDGRLGIRFGVPEEPAATLTADPGTLLDIRLGRISLERAQKRRAISFGGSKPAIRRLRRAFAL
jgi:DNA-binding HxlR family transcriptional regulator